MAPPPRSSRSAPGTARARSSRRRGRLRLVAVVGGALLAVVGVGVGLAVPQDDDRAPARVSVEGVDVSGLEAGEVERAVRRYARETAGDPVEVVVEGTDVRVRASRESLDARPRIPRAVRDALEPRSLGGRLLARVGVVPEREVDLRYALDPGALNRLVKRVTDRVNDPSPVPARVRVRDDAIEALPGRPGHGVDARELRERVRDLPERIVLTPGPLDPPVPREEAEAARRRALALIDGPVTVALEGRGVEIEPAVLRDALRFPTSPPEMDVALAPDVLYQDIAPAFDARERPARNARFRVSGPEVRLVPSRIGRRLDMEAIAEAIAADPGRRTVEAVFEVTHPSRTTEEARELGITDQVAEFSTPFSCCPPRVTNIRRAAEILDHTIIPAGNRFSLNDALGPRTTERGFVAAPQIAAGRLEDAVGGGISQVATTLFNAAFFAGLGLVSHTPHEFYISRYPPGREATVSFGGPELVLENDWDAAVLISATATDSAMTIRLFSSPLGRRVETSTSEPTDHTEPTTEEIEEPELAPGERRVVQYAGSAGFTVSYTRKVWRGDELRRDETFTWTYRPQNAYVEVGPEPEPEEDEEDEEGTGTDSEEVGAPGDGEPGDAEPGDGAGTTSETATAPG